MTSLTLNQEAVATPRPLALGRALLILSSALAFVSLVVAIYGVAAINPEIAELKRRGAYGIRYDVLMDRTFSHAVTAWGTGFVGLVLGVVAATKGKQRLGWLSALAAVAGASIALLLIH